MIDERCDCDDCTGATARKEVIELQAKLDAREQQCVTMYDAGAEGFARTLLRDEGAGTMSEGVCLDVLQQWREMKRKIAAMSGSQR